MSLIVFILVGLVAGLIARAVMPGRQSMGLIATTLLGVVGSFIGGIVGSLLGPGHVFDLRPSGLLLSIVGALLVLLVVGAAGRRRRVVT